MCIAAFLWKSHPLYPFLLFLNRDEYYDRPTKPLGWWEEGDGEIAGGRDGAAGGTWLCCNTSGKVAFLTNVREGVDPSSSPAKSRGELPVRFLKSNKSPHDFAEELTGEADLFGGFNLVVVDLCSMTMLYITNRPKGKGVLVTEVSPGIHVLTNATLDSPWPKAQRLRRGLKLVLEEYGESEIPVESTAKELMQDTTRDEDENDLPGILSPEFEFQLSSIFVEIESPSGRRFGTRSTSALAVKNSSEVEFYERSYHVNGLWEEQTISFNMKFLLCT
ncbi:hypothetical protein DM860_006859 [Cuscuta australis]|uniref:Transport and Golgi organization protein 2 homolog n=1 Tax=Cuscuta australis TaxID=267555 RepID=A0A328E5H7_9ASTE|nr:hypothetical protein DM860_006859 [Cuscuta australis]